LTPGGPAPHADPARGIGEADGASPESGLLGLRPHRLDGRRMVLYVSGELDRLTAPLLVAHLDELLRDDAHGTTSLTIDLAGTSFVDIGGLNTLLDVHRRAGARGIVVGVGECRAQFVRLLRVTGTLGLMAAGAGRPRSRQRTCGPFGRDRRRRR
jgi:anti-anti-sigma factor